LLDTLILLSLSLRPALSCVLQRIVLFSADPATGLISVRHYTISTAPSGVKKPLKALVLRQAVPDMGGLQDVADLITKSGYGSVSV
jgi:ribosome biogenesis protein SSF1/2